MSHGAVWDGLGSRHPQGFPVPTSPPQAESCTHGLPKGFPFTSCSFPENVSDSLTGGWAFPLSAEVPLLPPQTPSGPWKQSQLEQVRLFSEATFEDHIPLPGNGSLKFCLVILACLAALSSKTAPGGTQVLRVRHQCCPDCGGSLWAPPRHLLFPPSSLGIPPAAFGVKLLISTVAAEFREPPAS